MGEYAIDQMMLDCQRLYGYTPDRSEFEDAPKKRRTRFRCATCGRIFKMTQAVKDHVRDKHHPAAQEKPPLLRMHAGDTEEARAEAPEPEPQPTERTNERT